MTATPKLVFSSKMMRYPESLHDNTAQPCATSCLCKKASESVVPGVGLPKKSGFLLIPSPCLFVVVIFSFSDISDIQNERNFHMVFPNYITAFYF